MSKDTQNSALNNAEHQPCVKPSDNLAQALSVSAITAREALRLSSRKLFAVFIFCLLILGLYLAYVLLRPFMSPIILAAVFATICYPVYKRCRKILRNNASLAAALVLLGVVILVIIPLVVFIVGLIPQMRQSIAAVTQWLGSTHLDALFNAYFSSFFTWVHEHAPFLNLTAEGVKADLVNAARKTGQMLIGASTSFVGQTLNFVLHFLLFLLALFFFLKDGERLVQRIRFLMPMREKQEERIIHNLSLVSRAVLLGGFVVAALQGFVGGLGLAIVGIPALFWGTVMAFASLVPVVGTGLVWVPAAAYLLLTGSWKSALFLAVWCGVLVTSIDTFLRPLLMREASGIPVLFVFLSILGGLQVFGVLGLLYGPLILTFAVAMLSIYGEEYRQQLEHQDDEGA